VPADSTLPLQILFKSATKNGRLRLRALWRELRANKTLQALLLGGSLIVRVQVSFFLLLSLVGAAVAALTLLFILEKAYGFKITGPAYAF